MYIIIFQNVVIEHYPQAVVYLFGSTVNGLGFKGCDIDAYVETGLAKTDHASDVYNVESLERNQMIKAVQDLTHGLRKNSNVVNVQGISGARVPIVKFDHQATNLSVDLSFKNRMAVLNTEFIRLCIEFDTRVRPVMMCIRYWASVHELSGGGQGGRPWKITNYALTMMIIFFLQVSLPI